MTLSTGNVITIILWIGLLAWGIWELVQFFRRRRAATFLENEEFKEDIRRAQVIDVREKDDFDAGHILGARNIPYTQLKQRMGELRDDQPIYLYDEKKSVSSRAALLLNKKGYENIFVLKSGYNGWDGKIKRKKKV